MAGRLLDERGDGALAIEALGDVLERDHHADDDGVGHQRRHRDALLHVREVRRRRRAAGRQSDSGGRRAPARARCRARAPRRTARDRNPARSGATKSISERPSTEASGHLRRYGHPLVPPSDCQVAIGGDHPQRRCGVHGGRRYRARRPFERLFGWSINPVRVRACFDQIRRAAARLIDPGRIALGDAPDIRQLRRRAWRRSSTVACCRWPPSGSRAPPSRPPWRSPSWCAPARWPLSPPDRIACGCRRHRP